MAGAVSIHEETVHYQQRKVPGSDANQQLMDCYPKRPLSFALVSGSSPADLHRPYVSANQQRQPFAAQHYLPAISDK
jgi:hypothetical protein